jgi:branched-subunit amino acid aminotransferase/4-amino-4-deoxychorismate lyase
MQTPNDRGPDGGPPDIAWLDGDLLSRADLRLPVGDAGFVLGATVTEQLRTFAGRLFLPHLHATRFRDSLAVAGIEPGPSVEAIFKAADAVASHNHAHGPRGSDLGVVIFATPGDQPSQHEGRRGTPRVAVHSFPLAFKLWAKAYDEGLSLRSVSIRQVPEESWPLALKCRSRMHYHLADREADTSERGSRAVLCHADGRVSETSTANIAIVRHAAILAPPPADALRGVSLHYLRQLAEEAGIAWHETSLRESDLAAADEILLTSTPNCLLPATRFNGRPVGSGRPGPLYQALLARWSETVGLDIAAQARAATG